MIKGISLWSQTSVMVRARSQTRDADAAPERHPEGRESRRSGCDVFASTAGRAVSQRLWVGSVVSGQCPRKRHI